MKWTSALGVFGVLSGFVACGGSSSGDGNGGGATSVPLSDVPELFAQAFCDNARDCWGALLDVLLAGEDCEEITTIRVEDELQRIENAIAEGKVVYDGTKMQACVDAITAQQCGADSEPPVCTEAANGTVALGGDCNSNDECTGSDTYCKTSGSCPGRCAMREAAGGICERDDDCAEGLLCSVSSQKCAAPAGAGDLCGGGSAPECDDGLYCLGEDVSRSQPGNCRTISEAFSAAEGQSCLLDDPFCEPALRCAIEGVSATGTAQTRCVRPVTSGAACKVAYPDMCPTDQYCSVPTNPSTGEVTGFDGTCTPKPGAGQPCARRGNDRFCAPGTRCEGGTCRPLQHLGQSCTTDDVCYSGVCEGGGCVSADACQ